MKPKLDYTLYLVTDRERMTSASIEECVEQALEGSCTLVQLREKGLSSRAFFETAQRVRQVTARHGVPLIINDRADIALAVGAQGVHVGQGDLPVGAARQIVGPYRVIGASVCTLAQARAAAAAGADYLGVGAMFATGTKSDADRTSMEELRRIRDAVSLPIVVIGGIDQTTVHTVQEIGIDGIAVASAIVAQPDPAKAARDLKRILLCPREKKRAP